MYDIDDGYHREWLAWRRQRDVEIELFGGRAPVPVFPPDPRWIVEGLYEPHSQPRSETVPTADGRSFTVPVHGVLRFRVDGVDCSLEPYSSGPYENVLNVGFRDATSGNETYAAARVLFVPRPVAGAGRVVLDFNRATNPPCAFSPFASCALPPSGNTLPVAVRAGEKTPITAAGGRRG